MFELHVCHLLTELFRRDIALDNLLGIISNYSISLADVFLEMRDIVNCETVLGIEACNTNPLLRASNLMY